VPTVEHDKPIDMLVTNEGVIYFRNK